MFIGFIPPENLFLAVSASCIAALTAFDVASRIIDLVLK